MVNLIQVYQTETVKKNKAYSEVLKNLSKNIKKYRNEKGLTQEDMVDYGFNYRFYQKLESGTYSPNLNTLYKVSQALEVNIYDLMLEK